MEPIDVMHAKQYLNLFSAYSDRRNYIDARKTASKLMGFAYDYFFDLEDKIADNDANILSKRSLHTRWNRTEADNQISKLAQLICEYDHTIRQAILDDQKWGHIPRMVKGLQHNYGSHLDYLNRAIRTEFSQIISAADNYYQ